jgi:hypothetical protein
MPRREIAMKGAGQSAEPLFLGFGATLAGHWSAEKGDYNTRALTD